MPRVLVLSVLLLALAAAPASAAAGLVDPQAAPSADTPVADVSYAKQGHLLRVDWLRQGGSGLGDDSFYVGQSLSYFELLITTSDSPFLDGAAPPVALRANLRDRAVEHPTFQLAREADRRAEGGSAPADADFREDGIGLGYRVQERGWDSGDKPLAYPSPQYYYGVPVYFDDEQVAVQASYTDSSDRLLHTADVEGEKTCAHLLDTARTPDEGLCGYALALEAVAPLTPNLLLQNELQHVQVKVNDHPARPGSTVTPADLGGFVDVAGVAGAVLGAAEGDEAFAVADEALPSDAANAAAWAEPSPPREAPSATALGTAVATDALLAALLVASLGLVALAIPLYRRIVRGKVLENDVRSRILELVQGEPGLHESAMAQRLGISHTLAQYHVRLLAEFGLVEVRRFGGRKCLFAAGQMGRAAKTMLLAEKGTGAQVVDLVASQPGIAQRELARALGIRESSVKWHLDRLEEHGVVVVARGADGKRVTLTADAEQGRLAQFARAAALDGPAAGAARASPSEPAGPPAPMDPRDPSPLHAPRGAANAATA